MPETILPQKSSSVCSNSILRRQQPQHLLIFSFSWEFVHNVKYSPFQSTDSRTAWVCDPWSCTWTKGDAGVEQQRQHIQMQEVQRGGTMKTLLAVRCLLSFRKPGSVGLVFYSWGRKHEKCSKQKSYFGGNEEEEERFRENGWLQHKKSKKQVVIILWMKDT